jgi:S1-C subfamily serine protease
MYSHLKKLARATVMAAVALALGNAAFAQIQNPPAPVSNPDIYIVAPPTAQQLAYAHQTARTGSFVTPPGEAYLGVGVDPRVANAALVTSVVAGSPAARAGILPGDVITAIGNHRITSPNGFNVIMRAMSPGAVVDVGVRRGLTTTLPIELGYAPNGTPVALPRVEQAQIGIIRR